MTAMIVGIDRIACRHERARKSTISASVFAHAMGDLHNRALALAWPAITGNQCGIGRIK